jgi:uncharacterized membrane protein YdjX (TVP38/TMEM64 family)
MTTPKHQHHIWRSYKTYVALVFLAAVGYAVWFALTHPDYADKVSDYFLHIRTSPWAPVIFVLVYTVNVMLGLPGFPLTLAAGPLFGFWLGVLCAVAGNNLGCNASFLISRWLGRNFVKRLFASNDRWERLSRLMEQKGFTVLFYMRVFPIIPYSVMNYMAGVTSLSFRDYAKATFWGPLPGTFIYVYLAIATMHARSNPSGMVLPVLLVLAYAGAAIWFQRKRIFTA